MRRGRSGFGSPIAARSGGRTNTSNDTSALTGLPGSVTIGVPSTRARALRHARLHRHLDELDFVRQRILDHLVGACADTAGGDDQVGVAGVAAQRGAERVDVVARHRRGDHLAAGVADRGGQHHRIGLVDLAGLQGRARCHQLGPGRHHQHPLARNHRQLAKPERGRQAERGRGDHLAGAQHRGARGDVLARAPDVLAGLALARIVTVSVPPSVASTGTTAVAPAGSGAPVMIRCAVPG